MHKSGRAWIVVTMHRGEVSLLLHRHAGPKRPPLLVHVQPIACAAPTDAAHETHELELIVSKVSLHLVGERADRAGEATVPPPLQLSNRAGTLTLATRATMPQRADLDLKAESLLSPC